ncbi:MAG: PLP-dependent aminotransferase family protein [Oscillospiraceae bacterium]
MNYNFADRMGNLKASAIREILKVTSNPEVISFAAGNPAPEAFPIEKINNIIDEIYKNKPIEALQYNVSEGYTPLRNTVKSDLSKRYGLGQDFDELIITSGAQQANELCCKVLCNQGDTIICESPSFIGSLNAFKSYGVNLVGVPMEDDGIDIAKLEIALKENKNTKIIYLIPNFQNPTGITMSFEKRKACYELALKYGVVILEDNPYGELRFAGEDIPSIKSLDKDGIVFYSGSFSKVLAPGLRVGYALAPCQIIQKVVVCKQVSDVHTNILAQMICNDFMQKYDFVEHISSLKEIYKKKCNLMLDCIEKEFDTRIKISKPQGGLFIWATLPDGVDMLDFCTRCVNQKVAVVPGTAFLTSEEQKTQSFRLNFSTPTDEQIIKGIEIIGQLTKEI